MIRRVIVPGFAAALALTAVVSVQHSQAAGPRGAECNLSGAATISPGLTTTARAQQITLSNVKLTNCHMGSSGAPGVPKTITGTVTTSPNPISSKGSCASGNLALTASIRWSTGTTSSATLKTTGLLANQAINGKATSSTDPSIKAGDLVAGDAAFKPTTTAQNCAKVPVTAVTFTGALGVGSPK
jgi:hypothetical protein